MAAEQAAAPELDKLLRLVLGCAVACERKQGWGAMGRVGLGLWGRSRSWGLRGFGGGGSQ